MRRMITTKQVEYVDKLNKTIEPQAIYPVYIDAISTSIDWEALEDQETINFEDHEMDEGTLIFFNFANLLAQYGLGEDGDIGYIAISTDNLMSIPEDVTDFKTLKEWMNTEDFLDTLEDHGYSIDESMLSNDVASYVLEAGDAALFIEDGQLKLDASINCTDGVGEAVVDATDPQYNGIQADLILANHIMIENDLKAPEIYSNDIYDTKFNHPITEPSQTIYKGTDGIIQIATGNYLTINRGPLKTLSLNAAPRDANNSVYQIRVTIQPSYYIGTGSHTWTQGPSEPFLVPRYSSSNVLSYVVGQADFQENRVIISLHELDGSDVPTLTIVPTDVYYAMKS